MANLEVKGTVCSMSALESGVGKSSGKEWKRKTVVVQEDGEHGKKVAITLFGDKADEKFVKDQIVTIQCNVESNPSNDNSGRWFTNINAWKIEKKETKPAPAPLPTPAQQTQSTAILDDLPF